MILYFSGTGNSRYVAQVINSVIGDELVSLNELIKMGSKRALASEKPFVFVAPTYAWRIPEIVRRFIQETQFTGSSKAYFVLTCGDGTGNAAGHARRLCAEKGFVFSGLATVIMPENYIAMYEVPAKEQADAIIKKSDPLILDVAEYIKNGQELPGETITLNGRFISGIVNPLFYFAVVSAKGFYSTSACIGCGKCAQLCPLNNIGLSGGKPQWGGNCTHCMACICGCPTEAIEYKNKSKGKPRYFIQG